MRGQSGVGLGRGQVLPEAGAVVTTGQGTRAVRPSKVSSPRGARATTIAWSDGLTARYDHRTLRGLCPCAHCQGHEGPVVWVSSVESASPTALEIRDLEQVGHYALALSWGDGHTGGIYTFEYLRSLAELEGASLEQLRAFRSGR